MQKPVLRHTQRKRRQRIYTKKSNSKPIMVQHLTHHHGDIPTCCTPSTDEQGAWMRTGQTSCQLASILPLQATVNVRDTAHRSDHPHPGITQLGWSLGCQGQQCHGHVAPAALAREHW